MAMAHTVDADLVRRWIRDTGATAMVHDWGSSEQELRKQAEGHMDTQAEAGRTLLQRFVGIAGPVS